MITQLLACTLLVVCFVALDHLVCPVCVCAALLHRSWWEVSLCQLGPHHRCHVHAWMRWSSAWLT
jgi:hypothetical protein